MVLGEVGRPGPLDLPDGGMTVLQAIAAAGGLGEWAMPSRTRVLRMRDSQEQTIQVDVSSIMRGKLSQDIELMPSDVIIVPERSLF
jgi:polysaccharide export outer membrane protein